jgi:hypothetical protein
MGKVSIDTPLNEITLRRYEKPYSLTKRELVKKTCLSLGILQPGDSRDIIVDIFHALLISKRESKVLSSKEVEDVAIGLRKEANLSMNGIASSNIRRQLKRLKDSFLIEKVNGGYRIIEFYPLEELFEKKIERFLLQMVNERIKEYLKKVDDEFK